jgi:hypothetical protein
MILIKIINLDDFNFLKRLWILESQSFQKDKLDVNFFKKSIFCENLIFKSYMLRHLDYAELVKVRC